MKKSTCCHSKLTQIVLADDTKAFVCTKCLGINKEKPTNRFNKYITLFFSLLILLSCIKTNEKNINFHNFFVKKTIPKLTIENLRKELISDSVLHPDVVLSQSLLETGNFTSSVCLKGHNLFGLKYIGNVSKRYRKRETTATGEFEGHACYPDWTECVKDYKLWQQMYLKNSDDEYIKMLKRVGYAENDSYGEMVHQILKERL